MQTVNREGVQLRELVDAVERRPVIETRERERVNLPFLHYARSEEAFPYKRRRRLLQAHAISLRRVW